MISYVPCFISIPISIFLFYVSRRRKASTRMNSTSSRSHTVFTLTLESRIPGTSRIRTSQLHLVDLAGSEKQSQSGATGKILTEGSSINKSLTTLGIVMQALMEKKGKHIPYRDSRLTYLLKGDMH